MAKSRRTTCLWLALAALLTACGSDGSSTAPPPPPVAPRGPQRSDSSPPILAQTPSAPSHATAATAAAFVAAMLDMFHHDFEIYREHDDGGQHFFFSGWQGDLVGLTGGIEDTIVFPCCTDHPFEGHTCVRFSYPAALARGGRAGWVSIAALYPDLYGATWGSKPGYDLSRYVGPGEHLVVSAMLRGESGGEIVELRSGAVYPSDGSLHRDSFDPVTAVGSGNGGRVELTRDWKRYEFRLGGHLSSVLSLWGWSAEGDLHKSGLVFYGDALTLELGAFGRARRLAEPRFVRSFAPLGPGSPDDQIRNVCFVYDNALAAILFAETGDVTRARLIADAMLLAMENDPVEAFRDGRLRNGYCCGDVLDAATGVARLPGWWNFDKKFWAVDRYALGTDCGNLAWAMIALLRVADHVPSDEAGRYVQAAARIGEWVHGHAFNPDDGYRGGVEIETGDKETAVPWVSTEHNLDLAVAFAQLAKHTGDVKWRERAAHAARFVDRMWDEPSGHFCTGTDGKNKLESPMPLDVHPWSVLAMPDNLKYRRGLDWAKTNCSIDGGYDFKASNGLPDSVRRGVWAEGTAQMALALRMIGREDEAAACLATLRARLCAADEPGALYACEPEQLPTGFLKVGFDGKTFDWVYHRRKAVAASAWFAFADLGVDPYWGRRVGR